MGFQYKGATISARTLTIEDGDGIEALVMRLYDQTPVNKAQPWAEFMVGSVIEGNPPLPIIDASVTTEEARLSYAAWRKLELGFAQSWAREYRAKQALPKE